MRKTKVRIVGDPDLAKAVAEVVTDAFECEKPRQFNTTPYRYAKAPGISIYITVKRKKNV